MRTLVILLTFCTATLFAEDNVTEIKGPLTEDGLIDFFKAVETLTYPPGLATDENGFRMFTRQFGVVGDATRNGEYYRLQTYEKLKLDPNTPPTLECPQDTLSILVESYKAKGETYSWSRDGNTANPWTLEQLPMLADWIKEMDKPLDAIAEMIRKPVFLPPLVQPEEWLEPESPQHLFSIVLPNVQLCRYIALQFQARAMYRVGQGNIDDAIDDKLIIHRLGRQAASGGFIVSYLVGTAIEGVAMIMPIDANPEHPLTKEQIQRILTGLDALPPRTSISVAYETERLSTLSVVQCLAVAHKRGDNRAFHALWKDFVHNVPLPIVLPASFDWNIVYRRVNEIYDAMQKLPPKEKFHVLWKAVKKEFDWKKVARTTLTRDGRAMYVADEVIDMPVSRIVTFEEAMRRSECGDNLQRLVWAIKLYQLDNDNKLPVGNWVEKIAPYLGENPEQYFSCPSNPSPKGETTYALVQYGDNVPDSHETILLVELKEPVPLDKAVITVDEVLEILKKYDREPGLNPAPHPGGMMTTRRSGAMVFLSLGVRESELSRLLGRESE